MSFFLSQVPMDTTNFTPAPTTAFSSSDTIQSAFDLIYGANGFSDEEMLATMQAIKNPNWWSNMMMPGYANAAFSFLFSFKEIPFYICNRFSWPEGSPSPPANIAASPLYRQDLDFGMFQTTPVMM